MEPTPAVTHKASRLFIAGGAGLAPMAITTVGTTTGQLVLEQDMVGPSIFARVCAQCGTHETQLFIKRQAFPGALQ